MPEDILREPPTHVANKRINTAEMKSISGIDNPQDIHWDALQPKIGAFIAELKTKYQDLPEYQLELIGDLYGGVYRVEHPKVFQDAEDETKEIVARIQHNQAHSIFYAAFGDADASYVRDVRRRVTLFERISNSETGRAEEVTRFWHGVKGEVAVLAELYRLGYRVFLPDYSEDPYEVAWENNEVLQWDIKSGVDMVAEKDGKVLLIDSKGRYIVSDDEGNSSIRATASVTVGESFKGDGGVRMNRLPPTLRNFVSALSPVDVRRVQVILPMSTDSFIANSDTADDRIFLQNFSKVRGYIRDEIGDKLEPKNRK